ncbi:Fe-S cluster assembly protein IscX [bacterium]|jgi:FeS assembly protein IscX|nr:Fe-S cluster assembly protein IscX [bacterium]
MNWKDIDDIAFELFEENSQLDPLTLKFTDLLDLILSLEGFEGERQHCNEAKLEAIQMAWLSEYRESQE